MKNSNIQWTHSTINPVMGCGGCELFPSPAMIIARIESALKTLGVIIDSGKLIRRMIKSLHAAIPNPGTGHRNQLTTTNLWHLRHLIAETVKTLHGSEAGKAVCHAIESSVTCYAAKLHLNRSANLLSPDRGINKGYAPTFEQMKDFPGRMADAAAWQDLLGTTNPEAPWKDGLPRLNFVSDMGDAFSSKGRFAFLEREIDASIRTVKGSRHLWLWLTKRPHHMQEFANRIGGFPPNVCAMTTVTGVETLYRVSELRQVKAACRGLSIEPLWERLPAASLDLTGIDWVIVGGESGCGERTRPFDVAWAEELRDHCHQLGVAFFLKQLGRKPVCGGKALKLRHSHGGDWSEWDESLRVREFPSYFHNYRAGENTGMKTKVRPQPARAGLLQETMGA